MGVEEEMFWASFHTLLSLKVKLLKLSPNYARNTQAHELGCKNFFKIALVYAVVYSSKLSLISVLLIRKTLICPLSYHHS